MGKVHFAARLSQCFHSMHVWVGGYLRRYVCGVYCCGCDLVQQSARIDWYSSRRIQPETRAETTTTKLNRCNNYQEQQKVAEPPPQSPPQRTTSSFSIPVIWYTTHNPVLWQGYIYIYGIASWYIHNILDVYTLQKQWLCPVLPSEQHNIRVQHPNLCLNTMSVIACSVCRRD